MIVYYVEILEFNNSLTSSLPFANKLSKKTYKLTKKELEKFRNITDQPILNINLFHLQLQTQAIYFVSNG